MLRVYEDVIENIKSKKEDFIDARNLSEYENGHIPGAFNMPFNQFFDFETGLLKKKEELMKSKCSFIISKFFLNVFF